MLTCVFVTYFSKNYAIKYIFANFYMLLIISHFINCNVKLHLF